MSIIKDLFKSKKFVVSLLGVITAVAVKFGVPETSIEELLATISPFMVYVGAQGFADLGKEKSKIETAPNSYTRKTTMKNLIICSLFALCTSCAFTSNDVQPVIDGALMKDRVFAEYNEGVRKLLQYLEENGMPLESVLVYRAFFQQRVDAYETLSDAQVAALAELSELSTTDILERVEVLLPQVKDIIEGR
jgi:hypothetical protein